LAVAVAVAHGLDEPRPRYLPSWERTDRGYLPSYQYELERRRICGNDEVCDKVLRCGQMHQTDHANQRDHESYLKCLFAKPAPAATSLPPEYAACHAGDTAACAHWRERDCRNGVRSACDYDVARKQPDPMTWCVEQHYPEAWQYRYCLNGSPDR
jgi:hypothetical protein